MIKNHRKKENGKMRKTRKWMGLAVVAAMALTACGSAGNSKQPASGEVKTEAGNEAEAESKSSSTGKKDLIIYNCAGASEYHEDIVAKKFQEKYEDKYNVKIESLSASDVVSKIEAQGFEKGKGNVNIVIMGDSEVPNGLKAGIFADLSDYEEEFHTADLSDISKAAYEKMDNSVVPIMLGISHGAICYNPSTEAGAALDKVVGDDNSITYDELKDFMMNDPSKPVMGRGRLTNSGPGDYWTWGLLQKFGEYGEDAEPTKSIEWAKDLYENGKVAIYGSTSATFKDLGEGSVDLIPHSTSWYYRLYALGKAKDTLPEDLQVDSFGLENTKLAYMDDENMTDLITGHFYTIPANLSDEDMEASKEYIEFAISPEINSLSYASLMQPAFTYSSLSKVEDEKILTVWNEVSKYWPERYTVEKDGMKQIGLAEGRKWEFSISDVNLISKYGNAWKEQLEANVSETK